MFSNSEMMALAAQARVRAAAPGDQLWKQGDRPGDDLLFLARGRVEYVWNVKGRDELVDVRDMGDLLGLAGLVEGTPARVSAEVVEDSLFYVLPAASFRTLLERNDAARYFVRRHLFWETRVGGKATFPTSDPLVGKRTILQAHLDGAQLIRPRPLERLMTCVRDDSIRKASTLMVQKRVSSVLVVDEERRPLGIVTSVDLVKHVILNELSADHSVKEVMVSPVYTIAPQTSATAAILLMLAKRVGQVCVTEDGTMNSPALDVCTHKDLLAQSGHHPAGLLREIRDALSTMRLRELCDELEAMARSYLEAGISGIVLGQIFSELYDELIQRLINIATQELSAAQVHLPRVPWAWMTVGSDGRREQVLRTDMDNAFIFAASGSPEQDELNRQTFLQLTSRVVELLVECGFSRCQGGVMASNPRWCKTDAEWHIELSTFNGADSDALLRAAILYDLRYVVGAPELVQMVRQTVFETTEASVALQRRLAEQVIARPPPLNFWGNFVVEKRGAHEGEFDIKQRALAPLRDAARVFALRYGLSLHHSTGGRLEELAEKVPAHADLARLAYDGYDELFRLRCLTGLARADAGRFIDPSKLTKLERAQLSNIFDVVRMVQNAIRIEFRLESLT